MVKKQSKRKSGLIENNSELREYQEELQKKSIEVEDITDDYAFFKNEYDNFASQTLDGHRKKAYLVTFTDIPSLCYIAFEHSKNKARGVAVMYFRDFHPDFMDGLWKKRFLHAQRKRVPAFDKYSYSGKVPVMELLKRGMSFSCGVCGKDNFTYGDIQIGRGFVIDDGFEMNPFTKGFVLCYHCYKKYFK